MEVLVHCLLTINHDIIFVSYSYNAMYPTLDVACYLLNEKWVPYEDLKGRRIIFFETDGIHS